MSDEEPETATIQAIHALLAEASDGEALTADGLDLALVFPVKCICSGPDGSGTRWIQAPVCRKVVSREAVEKASTSAASGVR